MQFGSFTLLRRRCAMADAKLEESRVTKESKTDAEATEPDRQQSANLRDEGIKTAFFLPGLVTTSKAR